MTADPVVPGEDAVVTAHRRADPGTLGLRYLLLDPAVGEVVTSGQRRSPATVAASR